DFTILILESPGAIAELGTFSMVESLNSRIFAVVPLEFHKGESYISRGPLSILSAHSSINVSYYSEERFDVLHHNLNWAIMLYKIIRSNNSSYKYYLTYDDDYRSHYHEYIDDK